MLLSLSDDISSICLVRECRELEQYFGTDFASALLTQDAGPREVKEVIEKKDRSLMLTKHAGRADMAIVAKIESEVGWLRLWDLALDGGERCVDGLKNLVCVIAFPSMLHLCARCVKVSVFKGTTCSLMSSLHM